MTHTEFPEDYNEVDGKLYNTKGEIAYIISFNGYQGGLLDRLTEDNRYNPDFIKRFITRTSNEDFALELLAEEGHIPRQSNVLLYADRLAAFTVEWLVPGTRYYIHRYDTMESLTVVDEDFGFVA